MNNMNTFDIISKLYKTQNADFDEILYLLKDYENDVVRQELFNLSSEVTEKIFNKKIYIRGLIEYSNICKNDCYYCGIRKSNFNAQRYRLTKEEILTSCENGYKMGFRTFVLQGGEDGFFNDDLVSQIIIEIKKRYPECALTLSMGEKSYESYKRFFECGADRYLLRHESIDSKHYSLLHPDELSIKSRVECLNALKEIGYQVGCGFMVGSPYQTLENIVQDIMFTKNFKPQMIGVGPFISHKDTPFCNFKNGDYRLTVFILGILRLMNPFALIPATTALNSISKTGRIEGLKAGANVIMPNLSPYDVRDKYTLYNGKLSTGFEGAESVISLEEEIKNAGFRISFERGDYKEI